MDVGARCVIISLDSYYRLLNHIATVPIYDLTQAIRSDNPPACNQETLSGATEWIHGEIPDDSYVCLHYVPGQHDHGTGHKDVQFNLLRVVVMATPSK